MIGFAENSEPPLEPVEVSQNLSIAHMQCSVSSSTLQRQIRAYEHSLYNCLCSISDDAEFVQEISCIYHSLPLFANLRCGLWYVPDCERTCYFKSTDGHTNNWAFSTTRLNLHVAEQAAACSGCLVVDATRRGKTFPVGLACESSSQQVTKYSQADLAAFGPFLSDAAKEAGLCSGTVRLQ